LRPSPFPHSSSLATPPFIVGQELEICLSGTGRKYVQLMVRAFCSDALAADLLAADEVLE